MKNKFKLLTLAICGALYVGDSYADENFFRTPITFRTNFLGIENPRFASPNDIINHWQLRYDLDFQNCWARVVRDDPFLYTCSQILLQSLRPLEGSTVINGQSDFLYDSLILNHETYIDPDTGNREFRIRPNDDIFVGRIFLGAVCPEGTTTRIFEISFGVRDSYCVIPDTTTTNIFSVGNPINYISRQKNDLDQDFLGRAGLNLTRYYRNQNEGWTLDDTSSLVDLYNVEVGVPVEVKFKSFLMEQLESSVNDVENIVEVNSTLNSVATQYTAPNEVNRKVVIADQYGITHSYFGGPSVFHSSVDSSLLIYTPESVENNAVWKLVDPNGVQQIFDNVGNVTEVRYPNGDIVYYQYDESGRIVKKENKLGDNIVYEYDAYGNTVKAIVMPENIVFDYVYESIETDSNSFRLIEVKQDKITTLKYFYDELSRPLAMTSVSDGNDVTQARWDYNVTGDAILTSPDNVESFSLVYNQSIFGPRRVGGSEFNFGRGPIITNPTGTTTGHTILRIAGYDRVIATVNRDVDGVVTETEFFTYDSLGNLNSATDGNGDVIYRAYDENRFLIRESTGYRWNNGEARSGVLSNPLSSLVGSQIKTTNFCWDSNTGLRTKIITDDLVTTFVYSELGQIINTIEEPANSTNNTCN